MPGMAVHTHNAAAGCKCHQAGWILLPPSPPAKSQWWASDHWETIKENTSNLPWTSIDVCLCAHKVKPLQTFLHGFASVTFSSLWYVTLLGPGGECVCDWTPPGDVGDQGVFILTNNAGVRFCFTPARLPVIAWGFLPNFWPSCSEGRRLPVLICVSSLVSYVRYLLTCWYLWVIICEICSGCSDVFCSAGDGNQSFPGINRATFYHQPATLSP